MFHISTMTSPEQQRRLIGNDIGLIYWQEKTAFIPNFRGNVNSVAMVIKPMKSAQDLVYKVGCFRRSSISSFQPPIPENQTFTKSNCKDFILTKMINGILAAHKSPPLVL